MYPISSHCQVPQRHQGCQLRSPHSRNCVWIRYWSYGGLCWGTKDAARTLVSCLLSSWSQTKALSFPFLPFFVLIFIDVERLLGQGLMQEDCTGLLRHLWSRYGPHYNWMACTNDHCCLGFMCHSQDVLKMDVNSCLTFQSLFLGVIFSRLSLFSKG